MKSFFLKHRGVTLLEILLVLVISSAILLLIMNFVTQKTDEMRRDRFSAQLQQILNAGLAYYTDMGKWPDTISDLQNNNYLPKGTIYNPWHNTFYLINNLNSGSFIVYSEAGTPQDAYIVAGSIPMAFTNSSASTQPSGCGAGTPGCTFVIASASIPGQNLNNAKAINYASLYHSGACVPVPKCYGSMIPQIYVVPASVSGMYTQPSCSDYTNPATCTSANVSPIISYTAFATGPSAVTAGFQGTGPASCSVQSQTSMPCFATTPSYYFPGYYISDPTAQIPSGQYWRVCLAINTEQGKVNPVYNPFGTKGPDPSHPAWGDVTGTVLAVTRCVPSKNGTTIDESSGSSFNVWNP